MTAGALLTLIVVTFERPHAIQRLIRTAKEVLAGVPICVGDQGRPDPFMDRFYAEAGVDVVRLPYDCGVTEARNRLAAKVATPYLLLCDDDFVFGPQSDPSEALAILESRRDVGVVGGRFVDTTLTAEGLSRWNRHFEMYLYRGDGTMILFPIQAFAPRPELIAGIPCYPCDTVHNFAVFRRDVFAGGIRWDPRFKSEGEHEDFYLGFNEDGRWRSVYLPSFAVDHDRPLAPGYQQKRDRAGGWYRLLQKWGLTQALEWGVGLRTAGGGGRLYPQSILTPESFFASRTQVREQKPVDGLEVGPQGVRHLVVRADRARARIVRTASFDVGDRGMTLETVAETGERPEPVQPTFVVTTMDRPTAVQRFVRSARRYFPRSRILVGDQSPQDPFMDRFYDLSGVELTRLDYDVGVSAARNALVERVEEDFFVLCDDDFVVTARTDFTDAMTIMGQRPGVGVVGGRVEHIWHNGEKSIQDWATQIVLVRDPGLLVFVPLHYLAPAPQTVEGVEYYLCDAVLNFAVFRTRIFRHGVHWDAELRSDAEHEDFFLSLKQYHDVDVAFLPTMTIEHHRPLASAYERRRLRTDGWRKFMRKWRIEQELDLVLRPAAAVHELHHPRDLTPSRFFRSGALTYLDPIPDTVEGVFDIVGGALLPSGAYRTDGSAAFDRNPRSVGATLRSPGTIEVE